MIDIINDEYALARVYIPIGMVILLAVMMYFHRHHILRFLYIVNILFLLAAIISYFILTPYFAAGGVSTPWSDALMFTWLIGIFGGYFLSIISVSAFILEHAQRHMWAKAILGIAGIVGIVLGAIGVYLLIQGILSLKSG